MHAFAGGPDLDDQKAILFWLLFSSTFSFTLARKGSSSGGLGPAKVASDTNVQRKLDCVLYTFAVLCSNSSSFLNVSLQY